MREPGESVYNGALARGGERLFMGRVLARILMWVIIIACVGYFAQQWKSTAPAGKERDAMRDAARSYLDYKAQLERAEEQRASDVPQLR